MPNPTRPAQQALITDFAPPQGSRSQRLKTVMGMGHPQNQTELQGLVSALEDKDSTIRWLAGSTLVKIGDNETVTMLGAFLAKGPSEEGRQEAKRVLVLISETATDISVKVAAQVIIERNWIFKSEEWS